MKHLLLTTIAAVVIVGCGLSEADRALLDAAEEGNIEAVKQHLAAGADVNANGRGTPLHYAAYGGHKEVAELLIAEGADVNESNGIFTPLDWAYSDNQNRNADELRFTETAALLRKHGAKQGVNLGPPKDIWEAATEGDMEAVKQFIDEGADVNVKNKVGSTPLLYAAVQKEIIELLIAKGADVNAKNNSGWTPLLMAVLGDRKEVIELLIAKGADVNAKDSRKDSRGETPLDWAIEKNYTEIAALLRKHGGKTGEELKAEGK
jgi:ankyrin repeat protein